jgi:hypothetical protein
MTRNEKAWKMRVAAAWLSIIAIVLYHTVLITLIFLRPDLDPSWHTISEWAIGPYGRIMMLAFLISAVSYGSLAVAIRSEVRGKLGTVGLFLLLICAIGTAGVGLFTTDPMPLRPPLSTTGLLHVVFGTSALVLLPFAALFINLSLARKNQVFARSRSILLWSAFLPLLGFVGFIIYTAIFVAPLGPDAYGPGVNIGWPPRVAFWTYMIWLIAVASQVIKIRNHAESAQLEDGN